MTEDEMKLTWCPHARAIIKREDQMLTGNMILHSPEKVDLVFCIGSACSQWRWSGTPKVDWSESEVEGWHRCKDNKTGKLFWLEPESSWKKRREGYCGIAGRPE